MQPTDRADTPGSVTSGSRSDIDVGTRSAILAMYKTIGGGFLAVAIVITLIGFAATLKMDNAMDAR